MRNSITILLIILILSSCASDKNTSSTIGPAEDKTLINSIMFFELNAFDEELNLYYSELDVDGVVLSKKVYVNALSRLIYSFAYSSAFHSQMLDKAKTAANFQTKNLIGQDSIGPYFIDYIEEGKIHKSETLDLIEQSYGLCGLSELYRQTKNDTLLDLIHPMHIALIERFRDNENGGFWSKYSFREGNIKEIKTLQNIIDPLTSYMINLWLADENNRQLYEVIISENVDLAYHYAWNENTEWANQNFNQDWSPCLLDENNEACTSGIPGNNFKLSSLLLRASKLPFIEEEKRAQYRKKGFEILDISLKKEIFHNGNFSEGFYSEINPLNNEIINKRKTLWQHAEAIIAISLAEGRYTNVKLMLELFFYNNFSDFERGGDYYHVDENDIPLTDRNKGSKDKSAYHTTEMIRYIYESKLY